MTSRVTFTLCEGPHDVAFIYRILRCYGFKGYRKPLGEFPRPISDFLKKEASHESVENLTLETLRQRLLPSDAMVNDDQLVLLYSLGGDSKKESRANLITKILQFLPETTDPTEFPVSQLSYRFIYFFDADDRGIPARVSEIKAELEELPRIDAGSMQSLDQGKIIAHHSGLEFGSYIFASGTGTGTLENILFPMMKDGNEKIFDAAEAYLDTHHDPRRVKRLEIKHTGGTPTETRGKDKGKYDQLKSTIGIAGQLQNSGATNQVTIRHSDFLTLAKIQAAPVCAAIAAMFR